MNIFKFLLLYFVIPILSKADDVQSVNVVTDPERFLPTVVIALFVRNKAHTLPYFLTALEQLDYPKDRIALWIRSDHNEDNSLSILRLWIPTVEGVYHSIETKLETTSSSRFKDESNLSHWSALRFQHMISLREDALNFARNSWADFVWFLDVDAFITNKSTLKDMVKLDLTVVTPLLRSEGFYSNFWCGMSEDFYYIRTEEYKPILYRERRGCFAIPMVHSAVLVNLRHKDSEVLTFLPDNIPDYKGPQDDIIAFALSAKHYGVPMYVCNEESYGFITVPLEESQTLEYDREQVTNIKMEALVEQQGLPLSTLLSRFITPPVKDTAGFDEIFMINLKRRPERRQRMRLCFSELGLKATEVDAVDGRLLNDSVLQDWGIEMLPEYADPYHNRPLTLGEIGCFMSHYKIWKEVVERGMKQVMVLEDDIRFEPFFRVKLTRLLQELNTKDWDLVYLGRKRLQAEDDPWVEGSNQLVWASYSYWTLGYLLSQSGARKLIEADPLPKLIPVDEFLPLLFDKHPEWLIVPRVLVDVSRRSPCTRVLSQDVELPFGIAPTAMHRMADPRGEVASAAAAGRVGTVFILSSLSTSSLEEVAQGATDTTRWFQLYIYRDRDIARQLVRRAENTGYKAIVLTVDAPIFGTRYADTRNQFALPPHLCLANFVGVAPSEVTTGSSGSGLNEYVASLFDQSLTWQDISWLKRLTSLPIVLKGILSVGDAVRAADEGVAAIVVSNHGARQIDSVPAPIEVMPKIVAALQGRQCEIYLDGGVRNGTDIFKALALGATMVFVGRPILWGLACGGEEGVVKILSILRQELDTAMALTGCCNIQDITSKYLTYSGSKL